MFALNVNPNKETVFPSSISSPINLITLSAKDFFLKILELTEALIIFKSRPNFFPILDKAIESLWKQEPPIPGPGFKNKGDILLSIPMALAISVTLAPVFSQISQISLINPILIFKNVLDEYLINSAISMF